MLMFYVLLAAFMLWLQPANALAVMTLPTCTTSTSLQNALMQLMQVSIMLSNSRELWLTAEGSVQLCGIEPPLKMNNQLDCLHKIILCGSRLPCLKNQAKLNKFDCGISKGGGCTVFDPLRYL
jgi:hypothetical protein